MGYRQCWFGGDQFVDTVTLELPALPYTISCDMDENLANLELRNTIDKTCDGWFTKLSSALAAELCRAPTNQGPLAEVEFWKERHANLSAINEQLKHPKVQEIIQVCIYLHRI